MKKLTKDMAPTPMPHSAAQNSIRMKLILIPSCILALGIAVVIGVTLYGAKSRIASEISSGLTLGDHLIRYALDDLSDARASDAAAEASALSRLREGLAHVRHIKVSFVNGPGIPDQPVSAPGRDAAPAWFESLLRPATITKTYPVTIDGEPHGEILMASEPADEIAEIWASLLFQTALLTALSVAIVALIILAARHTLEPLRQLVEGLDRLGRGQFGGVGEIKVAELSRIGEHFNKLSATLAKAEADNHLLIDRLLSIQDAERKELARELHDEFGASLFGIRVAASCVVEAAAAGAGTPAEKDEIIDRAKNISALADAIQKQNYRILERIRPVVLRQMGLADALRQLVDAFAAQHRDFSCAIDITGAEAERRFDEEASLTAYRIVQECLTNVARHSGASAVSIAMAVETSGATGPHIRLVIADDGIGPPPELRYGFGLLGMSERARKLDGRLNIKKGVSGGMRIEAIIPVAGRTPTVKAPKTSSFETNSPADGERAEGAAIHS
ncbi:histidine kinase [Methylocella silvestris]|nr:histidine kinase [Methylocella silvestris]